MNVTIKLKQAVPIEYSKISEVPQRVGNGYFSGRVGAIFGTFLRHRYGIVSIDVPNCTWVEREETDNPVTLTSVRVDRWLTPIEFTFYERRFPNV